MYGCNSESLNINGINFRKMVSDGEKESNTPRPRET